MPLPCAEPALERFAHDQPDNALANYYLAIALWKQERAEELNGVARVESLLEKAVTIDPKFGEAYLQLGIVRAARGHFEDAIRDYKKAAEVAPQLGEAHYRLGLAYRRQGDESSAKREFEFYEQGQKMETAAIERQRREVRQFLIVLRDTAPSKPQ
jgi:tetratricopeptide (TPR) repeat protein